MRLVNYSITKVNTKCGNICYTYNNVTTQESNIIQYLQDMGERDCSLLTAPRKLRAFTEQRLQTPLLMPGLASE